MGHPWGHRSLPTSFPFCHNIVSWRWIASFVHSLLSKFECGGCKGLFSTLFLITKTVLSYLSCPWKICAEAWQCLELVGTALKLRRESLRAKRSACLLLMEKIVCRRSNSNDPFAFAWFFTFPLPIRPSVLQGPTRKRFGFFPHRHQWGLDA